MKQITSISIGARAVFNMHNLNNEGGEGNRIQTRMVDIVGEDGQLHRVNAISGDMLKHVQMEHLYHRIKDHESIFPLCTSCQQFNPNRINSDIDYLKDTKDLSYPAFIDSLLHRCVLDDIGGILITSEGRSISRKSVCEFGWSLAFPESSKTGNFLHTKFVADRGEAKRAQDTEGQEKGGNLGQNIFHRPASSGIYAIICHLELSRIGYNDITQSYALLEEERKKRAALLLESILYTFLELNGAMRSTQLPHFVALEGFISTSASSLPAPLISPLAGGMENPHLYQEQVQDIAQALNGTEQSVRSENFDTVGAFATQMRTLIDTFSVASTQR